MIISLFPYRARNRSMLFAARLDFGGCDFFCEQHKKQTEPRHVERFLDSQLIPAAAATHSPAGRRSYRFVTVAGDADNH